MSMSPHLVGHMSAAEGPGSCTDRHEDGERLWVYKEDRTRMARVLQRRAEMLCGFPKPGFTNSYSRGFNVYYMWIGHNVYMDSHSHK